MKEWSEEEVQRHFDELKNPFEETVSKQRSLLQKVKDEIAKVRKPPEEIKQ